MNGIITTAELQYRTTGKLKAAFYKAQQELSRSNPNTAECRNAPASIENINRALNSRLTTRPPTPGF
ncbi:MAG: hypothetical protein KUG61_05340 [Parvibaculaceae bacterium]|nr:hypothetical protein [Parvibaculaceae bacterium]